MRLLWKGLCCQKALWDTPFGATTPGRSCISDQTSAFSPGWNCDVGTSVPSLLLHVPTLLMGLPSFNSDWLHGQRPVYVDMVGPWWWAHHLSPLSPALLMMLCSTSLKGRNKVFLKTWIQSLPYWSLQWKQRTGRITLLLKGHFVIFGKLGPKTS